MYAHKHNISKTSQVNSKMKYYKQVTVYVVNVFPYVPLIGGSVG